MQKPDRDKDIYSFQFDPVNGSEAKVSFSHTFTNERASAAIQLLKVDLETDANIPQGDATLEHAVYGLYARKDIVHPDQKTGVVYKAGEQVASHSAPTSRNKRKTTNVITDNMTRLYRQD